MRLVKAARLTQNITIATATIVPDSVPRPSEQAPEPCKRLSSLSGRRLRRKQTAPGEAAAAQAGGQGLRRKQLSPPE